MKKIFIPIIVILITLLIYINFKAYKAPKDSLIISQQKAYSLKKDEDLNIYLYTNKHNAFFEKEAVEDVYLENNKESKRLSLKLNQVIKLNKYDYLDESFTQYNFNFTIPELSSYFYIEEAYLFIRLKNGHEQKLSIGSFDYYTEESKLDLVLLYGTRYDDFPTLETISFKFNLKESIFIEHIYLSNSLFTYVGKTIKDDELLEVNFNKQDKITDQLAIKIVYQLNNDYYEEVLNTYLFYESFENPLDYGVLNNVYIIDWNNKPD